MSHILTATEKVTFIRGRTKTSINITFRGFRYSKDGKTTMDGRQAWRCVRKNDKCTGRIYTHDDRFLSETRPHFHDPDFTDCEVKEILSETKEIAASSSTCPSEILTSLKRKASAAAQLQLPEKPAWKSTIHYVRRSENPTPPAPTSLADLTLAPGDILSFSNEEMLIFDNKSADSRIIIFGTQKNLDILLRCPSWYVDGTFKCSPHLFYQMITIHGEVPDFENGNPWVFPLVYILLTHKDADIYKETFEYLATLRDFKPDVIMSDFERALRNSLSSAFPTASMDGCHFHFCQAVLRWVREHGLKRAYERGTKDPVTGKYEMSQVRIWVRRFHMLAFVPEDEVVPSFISLLEHIPEELGLDDFLDYFESTWIQGISTARRTGSARFPPSSWNCVDRTECNLNRTNGTLEVFNRTFAARIGHAKPTLWNFVAAMYLEQSDTDCKILKETCGDIPPPKKKRQITKDRRVRHIVTNYDLEATPLIEYLDNLRNVSADL